MSRGKIGFLQIILHGIIIIMAKGIVDLRGEILYNK